METCLSPAAADLVTARPALVALDWGTSSLRAFLMDARGGVIAERSSNRGIRHLAQPGEVGFTLALAEIAGDWLGQWPGLPRVASGMVGSAQGWREAPYVDCPADTGVLAGRAGRVENALGRPLLIAPGLRYEPAGGAPDVMRGEEIQIAGALAMQPRWAKRACIVLPGTHSKWAWIEDGRITGFRTYMTGELYAVLRGHSLLGQLMSEERAEAGVAAQAFADGLARARDSGPGDLSHQIFATRTLGLTGRLPAAALADYLSGLLIGHELVSALAQRGGRDDGEVLPLVLVGDAALSRRYAEALAAFGRTPAAQLGNTAPQGLFRFACAAGLIDEPALAAS
ncbi:2-dehydro-3-deoxygalactonokinase [Caldimonas tepidiphila]|uniref:2-dehydro-3-deoxygalactonokinase n=1 Tax=Caldimonas tepidiphila TaxID=2315841 RepID=UPI000E5A8BEB|nr:2-dehydro-3-deoxygalactonokinase [Caldimonas tepidiphila]